MQAIIDDIASCIQKAQDSDGNITPSFDNIYRAFQQNKLLGRLTVDNSQAFGECIIKELKRKADGSTKDLKELVTILVANLADFIKS